LLSDVSAFPSRIKYLSVKWCPVPILPDQTQDSVPATGDFARRRWGSLLTRR